MAEVNRQHDRVLEVLEDLTIRRDALSEEAYARTSNGTFTVDFGQKMEADLAQLNAELEALREEFTKGVLVTKFNHHTFRYRLLALETEQTQKAYFTEKLSVINDKGSYLIEGLKEIGVDISVKVPTLSEVLLDTKSNHKTRAMQSQLYEGGLADPIHAANIVLEAYCTAKTAGVDLKSKFYSDDEPEGPEEKGLRIKTEAMSRGLWPGTAVVLEYLCLGYVRIGGGAGFGALFITHHGFLHAEEVKYDGGSKDTWALGRRAVSK
jgi:hypothetical protein